MLTNLAETIASCTHLAQTIAFFLLTYTRKLLDMSVAVCVATTKLGYSCISSEQTKPTQCAMFTLWIGSFPGIHYVCNV